MTYKLRCAIRGHESDVRAVCPAIFPEGAVLTASRDQTCRLWVPAEEGSGDFAEGHIFSGHTRYISAVTAISPSEKYPHGLVATGGHDNLILVFSLDSTEPVLKLEGHTGAVSCLMSGKFGTLLSGSWDQSACVWVNGQCVMQLKGHTASIWAVHMMTEHGIMLTGSADKTIKIWKAGKCERTLTGHTDCVRGLAILSSLEFLSCANDCTVRRWSIAGECLQVYSGHTNYIYSIATLPFGDGSFATCGEDRSLRIWKDNACAQTIILPCQSIWSVDCLPNGDIIVGSSDGIARIFTCAEERVAPLDILKVFEDEVANQAIPAAANVDLGEIKKDELPGPEALLNPGNKDGQTKLIKRGTVIEAHQWDAAQNRWQKVGEVVGSAGSEGSSRTSNKQVYNGQEYDYVFDVDIEEGKPTLKLPYNITDDPWLAAHKFLEANEISPMFLDQVANFIIKNTEGVTIGQSQPGFTDPFTGGSRYVPGSTSSNSDPQLLAFQDPFTGGNRYRPQESASQRDSQTSGFQDPFTGGTRYKPGEEKMEVSENVNSYFPKMGYLSFDSGKTAALIGKLKEFNSEVSEEVRLKDTEITQLSSALESFSSVGFFDENVKENIDSIIEKLIIWPEDLIFPGLDAIRLLIRKDAFSEAIFNGKAKLSLVEFLMSMSRSNNVRNSMLVQRIFCNCFQSQAGLGKMLKNRETVLESAEASFTSNNKNWMVASSSVILNYCVALKSKGSFEENVSLINTTCKMIKIASDGESQFRLLVGLGTLVFGDEDRICLARSLDIESDINNLKRIQDPKKVGECASALLAVLK
eukprot:gene16236-17875_t